MYWFYNEKQIGQELNIYILFAAALRAKRDLPAQQNGTQRQPTQRQTRRSIQILRVVTVASLRDFSLEEQVVIDEGGQVDMTMWGQVL